VARPPEQPPIPVVLAPDVIGKAFFNPDCLQVLHLWRDGRIRPVVTPGLLRLYVGVLRALTVPDAQIRRWLWWLTSPETAQFLQEPGPVCGDLHAVLTDAAERGHARFIASTAHPSENKTGSGTPAWTGPGNLVERARS